MSREQRESNLSAFKIDSKGYVLIDFWAPKLRASSTEARSFIRKIRSLGVSLDTTEFFRIWAYLENFKSFLIKNPRRRINCARDREGAKEACRQEHMEALRKTAESLR